MYINNGVEGDIKGTLSNEPDREYAAGGRGGGGSQGMLIQGFITTLARETYTKKQCLLSLNQGILKLNMRFKVGY